MIEDKIINIDVLEGLRSLPDNSIDLIVTSPPFNKGEWSLNRRQPSYTKRRHIDYGDWTILNINNAPILEGGEEYIQTRVLIEKYSADY